MNIIETVKARILSYYSECKTPCKLYATQAAAEKAVSKVAMDFAKHLGTDVSANYIVFFIEEIGKSGKWVGAVDGSELISRPTTHGGFIGFAASSGFYSY